jgi:gliding motility-associated-like protein
VDGGLPPYTFSWSNGSQNGQAIGLGAGWVSVTVTDEVGCVAVDSVFLESPDSLLFDFAETQPDCFTGALGAIAINQVSGGQAPYQFAINQKGWQPGPLFQDLPAGNYQVLVADVNGCQASSAAYLKPYTELFVYLGQDETIEFGDSVTLKPFILPFSLMDSIYWGGVDCPGCLQVTVVPGVTSTYTVTAVDSLGCRVSDELEVVVNKNLDVYIPNVFSPDNNGINDLFVIFGGSQLVRVRELQIFNRWGEAVFTHFNFPPNDLAFGWDGTHRGQRLDPAVFVYFALLEFLDGSTKLVKGDVTLMR